MTADAPFEIQARRLGDDDYYTSPYSMLYELTIPLMPPLGTTAAVVNAPNPTYLGSFGQVIAGHQDSFVVGAPGEDRGMKEPEAAGLWRRHYFILVVLRSETMVSG